MSEIVLVTLDGQEGQWKLVSEDENSVRVSRWENGKAKRGKPSKFPVSAVLSRQPFDETAQDVNESVELEVEITPVVETTGYESLTEVESLEETEVDVSEIPEDYPALDANVEIWADEENQPEEFTEFQS